MNLLLTTPAQASTPFTQPTQHLDAPASLEYEEIKRYVRQRYPFLLVDRVLELTETAIVAVKNVTGTDRCLEGHFPGEAILPGVLLIEAMAQAGGLLFINRPNAGHMGGATYLAKVDRMKFKRLVRPGDQVVLKAANPVFFGSSARVSVSATVDDFEVGSGEVTYHFAAALDEPELATDPAEGGWQ